MRRARSVAAVFSFFFSVAQAQDTFSICAVDTVTGQVGSAGASCIDASAIPGGVVIISDVHPGVGVIHTQSYWDANNQFYAATLMNSGHSPQQIIDSVQAHDVANNPAIRQYGVVDLFGGSARAAAFTGVNCFNYKNHIIGPNYAIQGNILLGQHILDSMEARFLNEPGDLACKLMAALQGAKVPGAARAACKAGIHPCLLSSTSRRPAGRTSSTSSSTKVLQASNRSIRCKRYSARCTAARRGSQN